MPGQGSLMGGQFCGCSLDARVRQIRIGDVLVGIVGLDDALKQLYSLDREPRPETAAELLALIKARNYVAPGDEEDYREALLREYTAHWQARTGARRS